MRKDGLNVHVFQNRGWGTEALYAELNEIVEEATSSYSATDEFLQYIHSVLVAKNHQKIRSRCLVHEFSFTDIF